MSIRVIFDFMNTLRNKKTITVVSCETTSNNMLFFNKAATSPSQAGDIERLKTLRNPDGSSKGVGFVTFRTEEQVGRKGVGL